MRFLTKLKLLALIGTYYSISYYVLQNPELIHKKIRPRIDVKRPEFGKVALAHRGGALEAPENTLQAFQQAVENGVTYLELDVRLTKDNQVVIAHDASCLRLCGVDQKIIDTPYSELPPFQTTILRTHFSEFAVYEMKDTDQKHFSLLEDLFKAVPKDIVLQIDLKDSGNMEVKKQVVSLIRKYARERTTVIGSENEADCQQIAHLAPDIPRFASVQKGVQILAQYWLGLAPFLRIDEAVLAAPYMTRQYMQMKLREAGEGDYIKYPYILMILLTNYTCNPLWEHYNKRGVFTNYWVINDEAEMDLVIKTTTVQGVMTDLPTLLMEHLSF